MTEPVAYLAESRKHGFKTLTYNKLEPNIYDNVPLYTAEQLHPRVKMTKNQHKQFENYKVNSNNFYQFWQSLLVDEVSLIKEFSERELMFVWLDEEAIEIVEEKKWFVRSKTEILVRLLVSEKEEYSHSYLTKNSVSNTIYEPLLKNELGKAIKFDTKEEAEEWTNPNTETILLPVEGE